MVTFKLEGLKKLQKRINKQVLLKSTVKALNQTSKQAQAGGARQVTKIYALKVGDVKKVMKIVKANYSNLTAWIIAKGKHFPLIRFGGKVTTRGVVSVKVKKEGGRKKVKGKPSLYGKPFIATMPSGHTGIWQRKSKGEKGIQELKTVSIVDTIRNKRVMKEIRDIIRDKLQKNFNSALRFYMRKKK